MKTNGKAALVEKKTVKIDDIRPHPKNAKGHDDKFIDKSIKDKGYIEAIVVDENGQILAGHGRWNSLKRQSFTKIDVIVKSGLSERQKEEYLIASNQSIVRGGWIDEDLRNFDKDVLREGGFDDKDIDRLFPPNTEDDDFDSDGAAASIEIPDTQRGDVYTLGEHRLMCGDSTVEDDVSRLMDGVKADMVFTDPPYGIGIDGQKESKSKNPKHNRRGHAFRGWDTERPDKSVFNFIVSLNIPSVIFGGNYFADLLPPSRGWIYWSKGQDGLTMSDGELAWTNLDKPLRCVTVNRANIGNSIHPTQKPVNVINFCLEFVGDTQNVLDLFGGSGSTLMACEQLGRKCFMMELDPIYCDVIIKRWEKYTNKKAVLLERKDA